MHAFATVAPDDRAQATGYAYVTALVDAIEAWSADAVRAGPAFVYRGADFRHAAERELYFELRDDERARAIFNGRAPAGSDEGRAPAAKGLTLLAPYLRAGQGDRAEAGNAVSQGFATRIRNEMSALSVRTLLSCESRRLGGRPEFLFLIQHPKFVGFLEPVVAALDGRAAFLTVDEPDAAACLAEKGLPALAVRLSSPRRALVAPAGALRPFAGLCHFFDSVRAAMTRVGARAIVVAEGNEGLHEAANLAAHSLGASSICIQYGWSPYSHNGFRNLNYDAMLVWGELFAELLAPDNPKQRSIVTGTPSPILSPPRRNPREPIHTIGFFLQGVTQIGTRADWHDFLDLIGWTARNFPGMTVLVREHPSMRPLTVEERGRVGAAANIRFMPPAQTSFADALATCDVVVSPFSTVLLEGVAGGAIPFIFNSGLPRFWPDLTAAGAAVEERLLDAAKTAMTRLCNDADWREALRKAGADMLPRLFVAGGSAAVAGIVAEIERVARLRAAS